MPDLNKIQQKVYEICLDFPTAINDTSLLLEKYWLREGWDETKSLYWNLQRATRPETITRRVRELREMGYITYSKEREQEVMQAMKNEQDRAAPAVSWLND